MRGRHGANPDPRCNVQGGYHRDIFRFRKKPASGWGNVTGRRLSSVFGLVLGLISFFLPLLTVSAPGNEMRWSGYTIVSGLVGFASENFYDIGTALVYGDSDSTPDSGGQKQADTSDSHGLAVFLAISSFASICASYVFLVIAAILLMKYSPKTMFRLATTGLATTSVALMVTFVFVEQIQSRGAETFASQRGLARIDVGYGLYLLLGAFAVLLVLQRVAALDRLLAPAE